MCKLVVITQCMHVGVAIAPKQRISIYSDRQVKVTSRGLSSARICVTARSMGIGVPTGNQKVHRRYFFAYR